MGLETDQHAGSSSHSGSSSGHHGGKGGAAHGSGGAAHGKGGAAHGSGGAAHGKGGAAHGSGGAAHGKGGAAHGKGGAAHGKGGAAHGKGGASDGKGGASHGKGGTAAGRHPGRPGVDHHEVRFRGQTADGHEVTSGSTRLRTSTHDPAAGPLTAHFAHATYHQGDDAVLTVDAPGHDHATIRFVIEAAGSGDAWTQLHQQSARVTSGQASIHWRVHLPGTQTADRQIRFQAIAPFSSATADAATVVHAAGGLTDPVWSHSTAEHPAAFSAGDTAAMRVSAAGLDGHQVEFHVEGLRGAQWQSYATARGSVRSGAAEASIVIHAPASAAQGSAHGAPHGSAHAATGSTPSQLRFRAVLAGGHASAGALSPTAAVSTPAGAGAPAQLSPRFVWADNHHDVPANFVLFGRVWRADGSGPAGGTQTWRGVTGGPSGRLQSVTSMSGAPITALTARPNTPMRILGVRAEQAPSDEQAVLASLAATTTVRWNAARIAVPNEAIYPVSTVLDSAGHAPASGSVAYLKAVPTGSIFRLRLGDGGHVDSVQQLVQRPSPHWQDFSRSVVLGVGRSYKVAIDQGRTDPVATVEGAAVLSQTLGAVPSQTPTAADGTAHQIHGSPYAALAAAESDYLQARSRVRDLTSRTRGAFEQRLVTAGLAPRLPDLNQQLSEMVAAAVTPDVSDSLARQAHDRALAAGATQADRTFFETLNSAADRVETAHDMYEQANEIWENSAGGVADEAAEAAEHDSHEALEFGDVLSVFMFTLRCATAFHDAQVDRELAAAGAQAGRHFLNGLMGMGGSAHDDDATRFGRRLFDYARGSGRSLAGSRWLAQNIRAQTEGATTGVGADHSAAATAHQYNLAQFIHGVLVTLGYQLSFEGVRASVYFDDSPGSRHAYEAWGQVSTDDPSDATDPAAGDPLLQLRDGVERMRGVLIGRMTQQLASAGASSQLATWVAETSVGQVADAELSHMLERAEQETEARSAVNEIIEWGQSAAGAATGAASIAGTITGIAALTVFATAAGAVLTGVGFMITIAQTMQDAHDSGVREGEATNAGQALGLGLFGLGNLGHTSLTGLLAIGRRLFDACHARDSGEAGQVRAALRRMLASPAPADDSAIRDEVERIVNPICAAFSHIPNEGHGYWEGFYGNFTGGGLHDSWYETAKENYGVTG